MKLNKQDIIVWHSWEEKEKNKGWGLGQHVTGACVPRGTVHRSLLRQPRAQRFPITSTAKFDHWNMWFVQIDAGDFTVTWHILCGCFMISLSEAKIEKLQNYPHTSLNFRWSNSSHLAFILLFSNSISSSTSSSTSTSVFFTKV